MRNRSRTFFLFAALFLPLSVLGEVEKLLQIPPPRPDFKIDFSGERLKYEASWLGLKAGEAELKVLSEKGHYKIVAASRTTGSSRLLYKMDDAVTAETTPEFAPIFYDLQIREPGFRHNRLMWIDRKNKVAKTRQVPVGSGKVKEKDFWFYQGLDPVSLTFLVRSIDWKPGMKQYFEFLDGRSRSLILLEAGPVETVKTRAGTFRAIRMSPMVFELPRKLDKETPELLARIRNRESGLRLVSWVYFWIALEGRRPVVLARAYSLIGPVALELVEMSPDLPSGPGK